MSEPTVITEEWRDYPCGCRVGKVGDDIPFLKRCSLHASAPDLLAALERIVEENGVSLSHPEYATPDGIRLAYVKDVARAAIAKARGTPTPPPPA